MRHERAGQPESISRRTAERLGEIVEAAERAAEAVIDDAEAEARRYLEAARVDADRLAAGRAEEHSRLVDSLLADAVALRDGAERMVDSLRRAQDRLREADGRSRGGPEDGAPEPVEVEDAGEDRGLRPALAPVEELRPRAASATAGARLLATQLAVSGCSREEIERRLRNGFEIEDTGSILDAILGPEE